MITISRPSQCPVQVKKIPSPFANYTVYKEFYPPFTARDVWMGIALSHMFATSVEWVCDQVVNQGKDLMAALKIMDGAWADMNKLYGSWMNEEAVLAECHALLSSSWNFYLTEDFTFPADRIDAAFQHHARKFFGSTWESGDLQRMADAYLAAFSELLDFLSDAMSTLSTDFSKDWSQDQAAINTASAAITSWIRHYSDLHLNRDYAEVIEFEFHNSAAREALLLGLRGWTRTMLEVFKAAIVWDMFSPYSETQDTWDCINFYNTRQRMTKSGFWVDSDTMDQLNEHYDEYDLAITVLGEALDEGLLGDPDADNQCPAAKDGRHVYASTADGNIVCEECNNVIGAGV